MIQMIEKIPLISRIVSGRPTLRKVLDNIGWLFLDKVVRMGVGLFVNAWVARYLGPDQYGLWNYAIAFTSLFGAFTTLGLSEISVREFVKYPEKTQELLGTTFILMLSGAFISFCLSMLTAFIIGNKDFLTLSLIAISAGGLIFQSFLTIDYFYRAYLLSRYTVWSQNIAFLIISAVKIFLIFSHAPLIAFAIAGLGEIILSSSFLVISYVYYMRVVKQELKVRNSFEANNILRLEKVKQSGISLPIFGWRFSFYLARSLLKDSWPLMIGSISAAIYMKIDTIMVKQILGNGEAGYYSVAQRISESFLFLTVIITQTIFPIITQARKVSLELYYRRISLLYDVITKISFFLCLTIFLGSEWIIKFLFGDSYFNSIPILKLYVWTSFFVFLSNASRVFYTNENLQIYTMCRLIIGAIVNVCLNIILIKEYGLIGAALSSLISYSISSYFFNMFFPRLLPNFKLQTLSILNIFNPYSYIKVFNYFIRGTKNEI